MTTPLNPCDGGELHSDAADPHERAAYQRVVRDCNAVLRTLKRRRVSPEGALTVLIATAARVVVKSTDDDAKIRAALDYAKSALDDYYQQHLREQS